MRERDTFQQERSLGGFFSQFILTKFFPEWNRDVVFDIFVGKRKYDIKYHKEAKNI